MQKNYLVDSVETLEKKIAEVKDIPRGRSCRQQGEDPSGGDGR